MEYPTAMPYKYLIIYFVFLGICLLSTIYKTFYFKKMLRRQIVGTMFWSFVPVANTFKALLWIITMLVEKYREKNKDS